MKRKRKEMEEGKIDRYNIVIEVGSRCVLVSVCSRGSAHWIGSYLVGLVWDISGWGT